MELKKTFFLILAVYILSACSNNDEEELIGKWDDNIHLSTKSETLSSKTDSVIIKTKGDWWWISSIEFEDSIYAYYGREDIDLESEVYTIIEENFLMQKLDNNTLFVKVNKNTTTHERLMRITFQAGNYFDYVSLKQACD